MEKPHWRVRSSSYIIDSPYMRVRTDEIELPDGTIVPDYYVRESQGFVVIFPVTPENKLVIARQYRYGSDAIHLELPAGMIEDNEDPLDCARRELLEETGYRADTYALLGTFYVEPVRSNALARIFIAYGARKTSAQSLEPTEHIEIEELALTDLPAKLKSGEIDSLASLATCYLGLVAWQQYDINDT